MGKFKSRLDFIDSCDQFGAPIPQLNLNGKTTVGTPVGAFCSLVFMMAVSFFATVKFIQLVTKDNPQIAIAEEHDMYT